jgi:hypothetical protein
MIFHYEGHTKLGQPVIGQVEADSEADAARVIREDRGHYARELKTTPVEAKYEVPAVGGVAPLPEGADMDSEDSEESPTWESPSLYPETVTVPDVSVARAKPVTRPGEPSASPPCCKPPKREMPAATDLTLRDNVEKGAEGLRQLLRWSEAARKGEKHDDMPVMGKKAWELFEASFRDIAVGVFREAVVRSIFRE